MLSKWIAALAVASLLLGCQESEKPEGISTMGLGYSKPNRGGENEYGGATSRGENWEIRWQGPYNDGPLPIEAVRATIDNLQHRQKTTAATEDNAKLLVKLIQAVEEYDGAEPTIGGRLNDLIPKAGDE